ncbi:hypothetical protein LC653_17090 [Nostoc sp. CHAB 5784]|uniref:hypothetical protein n=1 Tax=Nostoc mirabile TaxID=2907820 RepID=UPI001E42E94D|nr:hypothetical protein [Nostoc mirabile]MCC5665588.1 hypothetical protein [Nostoc mirabile CHAB5784]
MENITIEQIKDLSQKLNSVTLVESDWKYEIIRHFHDEPNRDKYLWAQTSDLQELFCLLKSEEQTQMEFEHYLKACVLIHAN